MYSVDRAIALAIAAVLSGIMLITQPNAIADEWQPTPQVQTEITEQPIGHFSIPTLTNREREIEQVLNQGLEKLDNEDYEAALQDFNQVLLMDADHERTYRWRGDLLRQMQDYKGAVKDYAEAIRLNPLYWSNYINRGEVYQIVGNYHHAIEDYTKAIELFPEDGVGYAHRGAVAAKLGHHREAIADLNQAIALNPEQAEAFLARGNLYAKLGHIKKYDKKHQAATKLYQKAIADYQQAAKLFADQGYSTDAHSTLTTLQKFQQQISA